MVVSVSFRRQLASRFGDWDATLIAAGCYIVIVAIAALLLPPINEVPPEFPAVVLWKFRIASLGAQAIMWTTLGVAFGVSAERAIVGVRAPA
jgi:membrane associated rhomboid family serine protease